MTDAGDSDDVLEQWKAKLQGEYADAIANPDPRGRPPD